MTQRERQMPGAPPAARLTLRLLGPAHAALDGRPLSFAYDKLLALLAFLAVEPGRAHRREALADLLWPEREAAAARHSLSQALFHLRRIGADEAGAPLLLTTRDSVRLNPAASAWVDVTAFRALAAGDPAGHEAAAALYAGPFLDGFAIGDSADFEEWAQRTRERLRLEACELLRRLSDPAGAAPAAALAHARRWAAIDPLDEAAQRRLMRALAAAGQRTAALVQFEHCRRLLEAELGVEPEPATLALFEELRSHGPAAQAAPGPQARPALPAPPARLVGRACDLAALAALLADPAARLVTVTGPGGVGKTRLALQAAADAAGAFADGALWAELAPVREPARAWDAVALALGLAPSDARTPEEQVRAALAQRRALLLLDNCEHLLPGLAAVVAGLLDAAPRLVVLATSRGPLHLSQERRLSLAPLALPRGDEDPAAQLASPALALLVERARAVRPGLELDVAALGAICRALDGLPLALELAATRARLLGPRELLARLERRLPLLSGGPRDLPERHRGLAATIDWSYRLLSPEHQALFRRLAVFAGGWGVDSAEVVCADLPGCAALGVLDGLEALLDAGLIVEAAAADGEPRCTMLETIREFGHDQLVAGGELGAARALHARAVAALAAGAAAGLAGPEQRRWLRRIDQDGENVRAALAWCLEHDAGAGLRIAGDLGRYWTFGGQRREGRDWLERLLARAAEPGREPPAGERAYGLLVSGMLSMFLYDLDLAEARLAASVALYTPLEDELNLAWALNNLGNVALQRRSYAEAEGFYRRSLELRRAIGHQAGMAATLNNLAEVARERDDVPAAQGYYAESLALYEQVGDRAHAASVLGHMATIQIDIGAYDEARRLYAASYAIAAELGIKPGMRQTLNGLGNAARRQGRLEEARAHYRASIAVAAEIVHVGGAIVCLLSLGVIAVGAGRAATAATLLAGAAALAERQGITLEPVDAADHAAALAAARAALDPAELASAWAYGQALTMEQLVAFALERG